MKELMLGNHGVAQGLYEAGCRVISSYPGTPSTEITEHAATYPHMLCEWAPNEKVAMEVAIGASIRGARSFCAMKHVGLNVAADPLFTASYTGVNGGLVVAVADDPGMHSSQNEQDSRHYARAAKLPMVEPCDSQEAIDFAKMAYTLSEEYDTPVLLRLSTRVSHSQSIVERQERLDTPLRPYVKNPSKYVMMPGFAKARHLVVEERMAKLSALAETTPLNRVEMNGAKMGIIASGTGYLYAKEAFPDASFLKLGLVWPLPTSLILDFAASVDTLYIMEELDPIFEGHCKELGLTCVGKQLLPLWGEYSQALVKKVVTGETLPYLALQEALPVRPPVLCPGCPHRGLFYTLQREGCTVLGDIGCYTLGATAPLNAMDTTICMGASISGLHGFCLAGGQETATKAVAVIGDSTFIHSGITGLIDIVYNKGVSTVIIADNSITGMTGHQENPTTGRTLAGEATHAISIEGVCQAVGVKRVRVQDPSDLPGLRAALREELAAMEPSVIITRRPCVLLKSVPRLPALAVGERCINCGACLKIGCPALSPGKTHTTIDPTLCVGCGLCTQMCTFGAIQVSEKEGK